MLPLTLFSHDWPCMVSELSDWGVGVVQGHLRLNFYHTATSGGFPGARYHVKELGLSSKHRFLGHGCKFEGSDLQAPQNLNLLG